MAEDHRAQITTPVHWELTGEYEAEGLRLAIVVSRFNSEISERLLASALKVIDTCGGDVESTPVARVPGALELPVVAKHFARTSIYDAVICLGCVIRGETGHYDVVVRGVTEGLMKVQVETEVPVIFGVLTTDTREQALERTHQGEKGDHGGSAARSAIEMANLMKKL